MTKGFDTLKSTEVYAYGGFDVKRLFQELSDKHYVMKDFSCVVIHVGTNDIGSKQEYNAFVDRNIKGSQPNAVSFKLDSKLDYNEFCFYYRQLVSLIRYANCEAIILCSAVLPRPWDFDERDLVRRSLNNRIRNLAYDTYSDR